MNTCFLVEYRFTPIIAIALHDGHDIHESLRPYLQLSEHERSREEDPYTGFMIADLPVTKIKVSSSRFQTDLNRFKEKAVYEKPGDAWGLDVWRVLPDNIKEKLHRGYDTFYEAVNNLIEETIQRHGYIIILDVHTYNHRRDDPFTSAGEEENPEINVGTFYNAPDWKKLCTEYTQFLRSQQYDARENIKFKGGAFAQQIINNFGVKSCVLSVEFKKTFMDEWTGVADISHVLRLKELLLQSVNFLSTSAKYHTGL